ncbi:hypothetical protein GGR54DRAFT_655083 [Hypoxylon sp. NC1633]|nr:hypothetical protein GGR54DRAFT_655083 [Hypoxylon sp. NC1633]
MQRSRISWLPFAAGWLTSHVHGQESGWQENQVNATMCWWHQLRAATLKDTVYLDGGHLSWVAGLANGSFLPPIEDNNPLGYMYMLNFSTPFNSSTNVSSILTRRSKAPDGGAANNIAPNYKDGALLANNDEFYLYGGLLRMTTAYSPPDADEVLGYMVSQYGANKESFHPGYVNNKLPEGMTRFVTYGGAVNAPSENKAWYFGGYRSDSWGPIYEYFNATYDPSQISNTLIKLDMSTQQQEVWSNKTLPRDTQSRANPSVVWVPVGAQGILVVLGGVLFPDYENSNRTSLNRAQSEQESPGFMQDIDVYDIAGDRWYTQPTIAGPPQLAMGCAVVATAQDYSSFNIYYYGGYNGLDEYSDFNDDVWILSLPSFMWMKVRSGEASHARAGHQCVTPYPDQMITIGGRTSYKGDSLLCLDGDNPSILQAYNLTANSWMDSYDPNSWNEYGVPEMIHMMIGGDFSGGATMTTPTPSGWATAGLAKVFASAYPTTKLSTFYPYSTMGAANGTQSDSQGSGGGGGGGTPSWVGPVLGVVLGLVFITAVVVGVLLYRRRRLLKKNAGSEPSTDENGTRIISWMRGQQPSDGKTITTEDTRTPYDELDSRGPTPMRSPGFSEMKEVPEMPDTPLVELMDTSPSPKYELVGDPGVKSKGFIPTDTKHSPYGSNPHTPHSVSTPTTQSIFAGNASHNYASSISSQPATINPAERPDSPPLGTTNIPNSINAHLNGSHNTAPANSDNINSNTNHQSIVSGLSDRDAAHLRQPSDAPTVSSTATAGSTAPGIASSASPPTFTFSPLSPPSQTSPPLPVSPPTGDADWHEASDYMSVQPRQGSSQGAGVGSPLRRSVFREAEDDLGERERERDEERT